MPPILRPGGPCRSPSNPRNTPHSSGVRQQALAKKLGRPQSFIAKYEGGERRIDVVEFIAIARALGADPIKLFRDFVAGKPAKASRKRTTG